MKKKVKHLKSKYIKDKPHTKPSKKVFNQALYDFFTDSEGDFLDRVVKLLNAVNDNPKNSKSE